MSLYWKLWRYFMKQGVPEKVLGICCISRAEAEQISAIIKRTHPHTILEIGTYIGLSTGMVAHARSQDCTLVCVDPDLPISALSAPLGYDDRRTAYSFVRSMLTHFGVEQNVILLTGFFSHLSDWARKQILTYGIDLQQVTIIGEEIGNYGPFDLIFLDGDHFADAVAADLCLLAPHLASDGKIIMHDLAGRWEHEVRAGIARFSEQFPGFSLAVDHNIGFLSRDTKKAWLVRQRESSAVRRLLRPIKGRLVHALWQLS